MHRELTNMRHVIISPPSPPPSASWSWWGAVVAGLTRPSLPPYIYLLFLSISLGFLCPFFFSYPSFSRLPIPPQVLFSPTPWFEYPNILLLFLIPDLVSCFCFQFIPIPVSFWILLVFILFGFFFCSNGFEKGCSGLLLVVESREKKQTNSSN